jgi:predicted TIM-barrel fold metal-dependent hydrolase
VWLHDIDEAVAEVRRVREAGIFGGILLPIPPPGSVLPPLHADFYDPFWAACADMDLPVHAHGGGGIPFEGEHLATGAMVFLEAQFYATRPLGQMIFSGVFERHPRLKFVITEVGNSWVPQVLRSYDWMYDRMRQTGTIESLFGGAACQALPHQPSHYWKTNCWQGNSFMGPVDVELRYEIGVDKMMWGNDYPHYEGISPYTRQALNWTFQGVDPTEVQQILGGNAARVFGFDLTALAPLAAEIGPTIDDVNTPLDVAALPADDHCETFTQRRRPVGRFV